MEYIIASLAAILFATLIVYKLANNILGLGLHLRPLLLCAACAMFISLVLPKIVVGFAGLTGTLALLAIFAVIFAYFVAKYEDEPLLQEIDAETESACCLVSMPSQPDMPIQAEVVDKLSNELFNNNGSTILEKFNIDSTEKYNYNLSASNTDFDESSTLDTGPLDNNNADSTVGVGNSFETELVEKAITEDPVIQEEDPVVQEEDPVIQEEDPVIQEEDPVVQEEDPVVQEEDPVVQEEDPVIQEEDPVVQEEDPVVQEEDPVVQEEDPVVQEEDPVVQEEDPVVQEEDPVIQEEDPVIQEEDPVVQEEDPVDDISLIPAIIESNLSETDDSGLTMDMLDLLGDDYTASQAVQEDADTSIEFFIESVVETIAEQKTISRGLLPEESLLVEELEELSPKAREVSQQMPEDIAGKEEFEREDFIVTPEQSFVQEADNSIMAYNEQAVELAQFESEQLDDLLDFAFLSKESQDYSTAFKAFSRALSLYPNSDAAPFLVVEIGNILKNNGAYDEAVKIFLDGRNLSKIKQDEMMEQEFISTIAYLRITKNILIQNHLGCIPFLEIPSQVLEQIDEEFREWRSVSNI